MQVQDLELNKLCIWIWTPPGWNDAAIYKEQNILIFKVYTICRVMYSKSFKKKKHTKENRTLPYIGLTRLTEQEGHPWNS